MYKVFINDRKIILSNIVNKKLNNDVLVVKTANKGDFKQELELFINNNYDKKTLIFVDNNVELLYQYLKESTQYIEAAGGLVLNPNREFLFIYRYDKWDLPKGKVDENECYESTAKREVSEECGVFGLKILEKLNPTYHLYFLNDGKLAFKKTFWYLMFCENWENPKPQTDEDISKVIWVKKSDISSLLKNTYPSIHELLKEHLNR